MTTSIHHFLVPLLLSLLTKDTTAQSSTCTASQIDIALCLDGSGSMGSHYPKVQAFLTKPGVDNDLLDKFTISNTDTKVAVLRFESDVTPGTIDAQGNADFSGTLDDIKAAINVPLPGGTTRTNKCIDYAKNLFSTKGRSGAAQLLLIVTDGRPSDQSAAETAAAQAIAAGIVILGVGANVGSYGRPSVLKLTSNRCEGQNTGSCSVGLMNPPMCVTPCDDHYVDASTFSDLPNILDAVVDVACVDPGCQYTWGPWSECTAAAASFTCAIADCLTRHQDAVINFDAGIAAGQPGACPPQKTEECGKIECDVKADFLLLLDSSGSMSSCDWKAQGWFANEFVSRLPSTGGKFDQAQVSVVQFSSTVQVDQTLTNDRYDVRNVLDCDRCSSDGGTGVCSYKQKSGGTSTVIGMVKAISELSNSPLSRADAKKVIVLMTDGGPTGNEAMPSGMQSWCQQYPQRLSVSTRHDMVVCTSKFAQSKYAPTQPAKNCGSQSSYLCQGHGELKPLDATVVTVGINVGGYSGAKLDKDFKEIATSDDL